MESSKGLLQRLRRAKQGGMRHGRACLNPDAATSQSVMPTPIASPTLFIAGPRSLASPIRVPTRVRVGEFPMRLFGSGFKSLESRGSQRGSNLPRSHLPPATPSPFQRAERRAAAPMHIRTGALSPPQSPTRARRAPWWSVSQHSATPRGLARVGVSPPPPQGDSRWPWRRGPRTARGAG